MSSEVRVVACYILLLVSSVLSRSLDFSFVCTSQGKPHQIKSDSIGLTQPGGNKYTSTAYSQNALQIPNSPCCPCGMRDHSLSCPLPLSIQIIRACRFMGSRCFHRSSWTRDHQGCHDNLPRNSSTKSTRWPVLMAWHVEWHW